MAQVDPALHAYIAELDEAKTHSAPSVFWKRLLANRNVYEARGDLDADALGERVLNGYGFSDLPDEIASVEQDPDYQAALEGVARARIFAKTIDPTRLGYEKNLYEHLRALSFLGRQDLLDEYLEFIRPLRVQSTMSVARHWYYARQVHNWASEVLGDRPLDILEIGAGAGNLGVMLARMGRVRSYTIVDLPEMLVHSAFTISRQVEGARLQFETAPAEGAWTFISDGRARELVSGASFDLCMNFNSFMEMDREARDGYIDLFYATARPGALFVNVNRRQSKLPLADGGTWDNNPMLYPYRHDDRILVWEEDPFQTSTRTMYESLISLAVTCVREIGGAT